jgi:hypothetical protein
VILSGTPVRRDQVLLLASLLDGDDLAVKLARGLENENSIVALSVGDRQRIVAVLADAPAGLAELKSVLVKQMKQLKDREHREEQSRLNQQWRNR